MTTLSDARRAYREALAQYQEKTPSRTAILGDGRGTATSNVLVPGREDYVYARDDVTSTRFFQVLNQGAVQPAANLPVYIGYPFPTGSGADEEQVIRINYSGLGDISSGTISPLGPHHQQHEFRGGDDIILDSRQFLLGLVHPTDPVSMKVQVESFIYFWDTWRRWEIAQSKDLTEYLPSSGYVRWVLIAIDPETGSLVYRSGVPFATGALEVIQGLFTPIPAPAGNELPLGYVRLLSTTTTIDWTSSADNIGDARLWVNPPMLHILDRIEQLEGLTGNPPNLATMGAAQDPVSESGTVTGTGVASRIAYWDGTSNITSSASLQFDGTRLGLGTAGIGSTTDFLITGIVNTTGQPTALRIAGGAHTTLTASAEHNDIIFALNRTVQWATGNIDTQRAFAIAPPTYAFVGASTITTAATVAITGAPIAGTFATITTPLAFWVQAGETLLGATATSTAISVLEISSPITTTSVRITGIALHISSTISAEANSRVLRGLQIFPVYGKDTFTGLDATGLIVAAQAPTGSGTIATYATISISESTFATANVGLLIGAHPGGSTNYVAYLASANAVYLGTGSVTAAGGLNLGTGSGAGTGQIVGIHSTNGGVLWSLQNATAGTAAGTDIRASNSDGVICQIGIYSSSTTAYGALAASSAYLYTGGVKLVLMTDNVSGEIAFASGGNATRWTMLAAGHFNPVGAGSLSIGDASNYINDLSYKTLTDRGCLGFFDSGVEMPDGRIVSDVEALTLIQKHPTLQTVYGAPRLDYSTMPKAVYKPANGAGDDGAETTALISIMLGAIRELSVRLSELEKQ